MRQRITLQAKGALQVPTRRRLVVASLLVFALCSVGIASAASTQPEPKAGVWKFGDDAPGGFSLVHGKGAKKNQLFLTNVHSFTQNFVGCPEASKKITVEGRFPLKLLSLAGFPGYKAWGVGKTGKETRYSDSNTGLVSIPAKVKVGGKVVEGGAIKMDFSSTEPKEFSILIIEFGPREEPPCVTYSEFAEHA
jgi:hypothetical protein